ncbi:MAG: long-chain-fatty-acid--CoA ligase [Actinophytocola sp.]|nr:long-chain-fatty-acid--CoA ligase [Actinophytocola sp.]
MLGTMQDTPLSIAQLLRYGASTHGKSEVVTWTGDGPRRENYAEVGKRAARLANALRSLGVTGDERVATFMWNNNEHLEAYLAIPAMGAVLHTLNIRLFPDQLVFVANHAEDKVVIVDGTLIPLLAKQLPELKTVRHVIVANGDAAALEAPAGIEVHSYEELLAAADETFDWPEIDENSAAAMCYTSGTTGDPKGVVYSHRSIWLHSMQVCMTDGMALSQRDKALAIVPQFHAMSWGLPYAAFMCGASMVMPDRFLQPGPIAEMLAAEKPTFAAAVPTVWQGLLLHLEAHPQDISHLREVVVGGSAVPPAMMHTFQEDHGVPVLHAWGMTETSPLGSVARVPAGAEGDEAWQYRYTQGRFPAAVRARVIDDSGVKLPWDGSSVGELEVQGPWIAAAYYGVDDPEKFHDGWLRTGDVGHITPDGFLTLTDRAKDVIKSGGEWISSVELENHVMAHPAVAEAAVVGIPDEKWDERPLVVVVLKEGEQVDAAGLREFLTGKVAQWQLPENWTFVDEVPKTSVGKFDKKRLRAAHASGDLDINTLR